MNKEIIDTMVTIIILMVESNKLELKLTDEI
jgi:hypothetical protein